MTQAGGWFFYLRIVTRCRFLAIFSNLSLSLNGKRSLHRHSNSTQARQAPRLIPSWTRLVLYFDNRNPLHLYSHPWQDSDLPIRIAFKTTLNNGWRAVTVARIHALRGSLADLHGGARHRDPSCDTRFCLDSEVVYGLCYETWVFRYWYPQHTATYDERLPFQFTLSTLFIRGSRGLFFIWNFS